MKKLFVLLLATLCIRSAVFAQTPQLLNYQGVARNGFGNALPNRLMTLRLSIRNGGSSGAIVYQETRSVTTNAGGLYSVQIGSTGTSAVVGSIAAINWQVGTKFLQVEVDPEAGTNFIDLGTTQLVSVPYAISAGVASPVGAAGGDLSGNYPNPSVANDAINTIKLADAAVTTFKLADQSVTTTKLSDYSVTNNKLADGAVTTAKITDANVTTSKLADASVTDAKIVTVAGSKVTGNITGNAANVTGTVALANGGTGATTAAAARTNLGLGNVDNTSDLNKPISTATQAALDLKENLSNKSTSTSLGTSDALYPTQNAVKSYVDASVASATIPDATTLVKGKVQLAGDLTGTAASPAVAAGAITTAKLADGAVITAKITDANVTTAKLADASVTDAKIVTVSGSKVTGDITGNAANVTGTVAVANGGTGATTAAGARTNLGLDNVDNTSDLNKPISTATQTALDLKENLSNKSTSTSLGTSDTYYPTQNAVKSYVDNQITAGATPDATTLVKGKVQLAGDLTGTAASPAVAAGAITTAKLADGAVTTAKITDANVTTAKLADASVTDAKIVTVAGSKVTGNITGNAGTVTNGVYTVGDQTIAGVKTFSSTIVGSVSGNAATVTTNANLTGVVTSVGNATAIADGALSIAKTSGLQTALDLKESLSNKSTSTSLGTSDALYPTQKAVKSYVDNQITAGATPDATTLEKGKVRLAGDLTGTAASPAVAAGAITTSKLADASVTDAKIVTMAGSKVTGNITGNAGTVTNGVYTVGDQTIAGVKTFSSTIVGSVSGNAATATTAINSTYTSNIQNKTQAQRDALATSAGLMVYNTTTNKPNYYNGTEWMNFDGTSAKTLAVGVAHQGGIIAYVLQSGDPGYDANVPHGIIAATSDQSTGISWFNGSYTCTNATGTALGTGSSNTTTIITSQGNTGSYAAKLCRDYRGGGYSDWYLPSFDELNQLFINQVAVGGFFPDFYWSSSEKTCQHASTIYIGLGNSNDHRKDANLRVRAVRAF